MSPYVPYSAQARPLHSFKPIEESESQFPSA